MKKRKTNDEKIIAAMDALDRSVRNLRKFAEKYNEYIDEAALHGNDPKAKMLIKQKIRVLNLAEQLTELKSNIELGAFTAQAISELGKLPDAIAGCKGLLAESPDFSKLGKSISSIFRDMNKSEDELRKLNEILSPRPVESIASRLEGDIPDDEKTDQYKAEYAAMEERLKHNPGLPGYVDAPAAESPASTGPIDYMGIVEEEKKKK